METYKKVIYDGHELMVPERLVQERIGSQIMRLLLNPNDWLSQHQYLCIVGIAICLCLVCAL